MPSTSSDAPLIDRIFEVSNAIRYVALYRKGKLALREKPQLVGASAAESDKYEELIVNPTLLKMVRQRGDIDCGGARFVLVGYGNFLQLVIDLPDGHVAAAFELGSAPLDYWEVIRDMALASG